MADFEMTPTYHDRPFERLKLGRNCFYSSTWQQLYPRTPNDPPHSFKRCLTFLWISNMCRYRLLSKIRQYFNLFQISNFLNLSYFKKYIFFNLNFVSISCLIYVLRHVIEDHTVLWFTYFIFSFLLKFKKHYSKSRSLLNVELSNFNC